MSLFTTVLGVVRELLLSIVVEPHAAKAHLHTAGHASQGRGANAQTIAIDPEFLCRSTFAWWACAVPTMRTRQ